MTSCALVRRQQVLIGHCSLHIHLRYTLYTLTGVTCKFSVITVIGPHIVIGTYKMVLTIRGSFYSTHAALAYTDKGI